MTAQNQSMVVYRNSSAVSYLPVKSHEDRTVRIDMLGGDADSYHRDDGDLLYNQQDTTYGSSWSVSQGQLTPTLPPMNYIDWTLNGGQHTAGLVNMSVTACDWGIPGGAPTNDPDVALSRQFPLVQVTELEWETFGSNVLDNNPGNGVAGTAIGKRMFPGYATYDDPNGGDRRKVIAKATITPAVEGVTVYFKVWDVDDPSASTPPLDLETYGVSIDNRGWMGNDFHWDGADTTTSAQADVNGVATAILLASMQPGDNCRVTAGCYSGDYALGTQAQVEAATDPQDGKVSEMLTVWRELHIEVDSMGAPWLFSGEWLFDGDTDLTGASEGLATLTLWEADRNWLPAGQLIGGTLDSNTNDAIPDNFVLTGSTQNLVGTGSPAVNLYTGGGAGVNLTTNGVVTDPFEIWVDDPDPGDIVECSLANMSDCFMECYVRVVRDLTQHEGDGVPFLRNFPDVQDLLLAGEADRGCLESPNFWSVYLQFVFEYSLSRDNDPDGENGQGGANTSDEPEYAFVFVEACKDVGAEYSQSGVTIQTLVATHEIGHQFECAHTADGSIMDKNLINLVPGTRRFSDVSKNTIRSAGCP